MSAEADNGFDYKYESEDDTIKMWLNCQLLLSGIVTHCPFSDVCK
jgi:hypothetical protein